jgi:hypothetical protein
MPRRRNLSVNLVFSLFVSFFGLFTTLMIAFFLPVAGGQIWWRKMFVSLLFSVICVLGAFAAFSPKHCAKIMKLGHGSEVQPKNHPFEGHHPKCSGFSSHVVKIRNKKRCAACTGLSLGALLALIGIITYLIWDFPIHSEFGLALGAAMVVLGFTQFMFARFIRLMMNTLFVFGAFTIFIVMDRLVGSLLVDLFLLCVIVFWIFTRIALSQWEHNEICKNCTFSEGCYLDH